MDEATYKYERGQWGKDTVTGFEGWITARSDHITGCNTYLLVAECKDGKPGDTEWVDENRLKIKARKTLKIPGGLPKANREAVATGGPQAHPAPRTGPSRR